MLTNDPTNGDTVRAVVVVNSRIVRIEVEVPCFVHIRLIKEGRPKAAKLAHVISRTIKTITRSGMKPQS